MRIVILVVASALPSILLSTYVALQHRTLSVQRAVEELHCRVALIEALFPTLGPEALQRHAAEHVGRGQTVAVIDDAGLVLAQHPSSFGGLGKRFPNADVLGGVGRGETFFDVQDSQGIRQLYAARRTSSAQTVIISMPKAMAYDQVDRALGQMLLGMAAATAALLTIAWVGANRMILAPIRLMLDVTHRVQDGDMTARTGMRTGREELSQLGASLDAMAERLAERERSLQAALDKETRLALTDPLTGLYNRRFLCDAIERQIAAVKRTGEPFSVVLFDLDRFKSVNDRFGHDVGDVVLAQTASVLLRSIRASDFAVRHGGEEFAVLLLNANLQVAAGRAEEIRRALEAHEFFHGPTSIRVTASFGVAQFEPDGNAESLLKAVDAAMYAAKAAGRNRVMLAARNQRLAR